ncbi:MAG TPA: AI-2E family transporter [Anaerolineae bacterium]|nr:AI-2E family transporter [Anaerolineae bacterium]
MGLYQWWQDIPRQRRGRLMVIVAQFVVLGGILWAARNTLAPYMLGLALAYLIFPLVTILEQGFVWLSKRRRLGFLKRVGRPLSIVLVYLISIALVAGFIALVIPMVKDQAVALWDQREAIWDAISRWGEDLLAQYRLLPEQVQAQTEEALTNLSAWFTNTVRQALAGTVGAITYTASLVLAVLIIPFWTFFLIKDYDQLENSMLNIFPISWRTDIVMLLRLVDRTLSSYLRGQLLLGVIIGITSAIGLSIIGVRFSLLLGLIAGVFELIPNIGPLLGGIPAVLIALAQDPTKALITAIFVIALQQVENIFLTPRVLGESVQIHPAVVMVVLVIGSELGGVLGLFLAPVATALLRDLFKYVYYRLADIPLSPEAALYKVYRGEAFRVEM